MSTNLAETGEATVIASGLHSMAVSSTAQLITNEDKAEALGFLARRPLHTVSMTALILENGLVSAMNRGAFYACRNEAGQLEGVALIGHATLIEAHSDNALKAFAHLAQNNPRAHLIRGEQEMIERFWTHYTPVGCAPRLVCRELLLEQRQGVPVREPVKNLRPATLDDLETVLTVNAEMIYEECGVNPLQTDLTGFRLRTARRIELGRIWVWIENGRLIFKTDVMSSTPEVIYLEGVHVNPEERGKGYGFRCFSQLCQLLLLRTRSICLLVNEHNQTAINFYNKAGYTRQGCYDTVYLQRNGSENQR
ncbi:MAG TPA: GNAT family N-acetyltransferase [Pyrinomonadaceae bacterium]|jgi:predicted GNAT family acetyltransferase|nr:GNAT family N-acetyltransferase [Pyrinomonadaceae bacterium]